MRRRPISMSAGARIRKGGIGSAACLFFLLSLMMPAAAGAADIKTNTLRADIETLAGFTDRSTGTPGSTAAARYIKKRLSDMGFDTIRSQKFSLPVLRHRGSLLEIPEKGVSVPLHPIKNNAISPGTIPDRGITGPLYYVGTGRFQDFNDKPIQGAILLMEMDSGKNWLQAASLGAAALIYVDRGPTPKSFFDEKLELTPLRFPRFWMPADVATDIFGPYQTAPAGRLAAEIQLTSDIRWESADGENIYTVIEGANPKLSEELIMVEAFYDSAVLVPGLSPGADEACGIAALLRLARFLKENPPGRSVLLVASSGHAQTLTGIREFIWSLKTRSRYLRKAKKELKAVIKKNRRVIKLLQRFKPGTQVAVGPEAEKEEALILEALSDEIKTEADRISRRLMRLRLEATRQEETPIIEQLADERLLLRRLGWRTDYRNLKPEENRKLSQLIPQAVKWHKAILKDAKRQQTQLKDATRLRSLVKSMELSAVISLHLSSRGDGFGAFNQGWLFPLKAQINRVSAYSLMDEVLREGAAGLVETGKAPPIFKDTLRPSRRRSWQSWFIDRPPLGGEISAIAAYHGITFATTHDARPFWGTPYDLPETVDMENLLRQSRMVNGLVRHLSVAEKLHEEIYPRDGFGSVTGRANFLRHGELFADLPAPGSMILAYQGPGRHHVMVDTMGKFQIKGVADKKHVLHKVIIEGYRFDPVTGAVIWAIDKKQTGKPAYRVKMQRRFMETDLVMFACRETSLFNLLEPRSFRYMTKINVLDGRRESRPLRYWWSRIDTRASTLASIYLEPGSWLKMTLSDTVLQNKLILTNASEDQSMGTGYRVDDWPVIYNTEYRVARDMWQLLEPRIQNLEKHGVFNERIRNLQDEGTRALKSAKASLSAHQYDRFAEASKAAWALASRVYDHVEKTQKDVLFGVLFYIALFVPFAFCLERLLFSYSDIYKRIIAFSTILLLVIGMIYQVHPAFQLAYSPMVVILAFFIMGLSLIVTLIIFFRFEDEMVLLQSRAKRLQTGEISRWKAFTAAFFLGVSNLRRRRVRTGLTCMTLIILTFTIMSFTSVKSLRHHTRLLFDTRAAYQGFLFKNVNWDDLPPETDGVISNAFYGKGVVAPRVWLEEEDRTRATVIPIHYKDRTFEARGMLGLSAREAAVTGMDRILVGGRWLAETDRHAILLPDRLAEQLGIDPARPEGHRVKVWGVPFEVAGVFSSRELMAETDLDGEPLTPVTFPSETTIEMTEVEMEALESGDDIRGFQSRYQHIDGDLTVIVPYRTLLAAGGHLKSAAVLPADGTATKTTARHLVDRFGLTIFSGEPGGTYLNNAGDAMNYSGVPNIIIPLFISVFIVLNTMISSVYERKREIGIYTSVGLAPSHVSFLFIAEAVAFAVLSVVMGYLLAQTSASIFAGTSLWSGITVNYSSLAGVAAMLLVILVVLVSVIYPSKVAAQIAIPDVNRSWKLPTPEQNVMEVTLPFLVKYGEQKSCGGYLLSHLDGHADISHGLFSTGEIKFNLVSKKLPKKDDGSDERAEFLKISSRVWLAPFDFGIMQQVEMDFVPAKEEGGFLVIHVRLIRKSGEANAWGRVNKAFINQLRKQLLVWRSLDDDLRDRFKEELTLKRDPGEAAEG